MVNIYIKDKLGKLILLEEVEEDTSAHYEKTVAITKDHTLTITITSNRPVSAVNREWTEKDIQVFNLIANLISSDLSRNFSIEELAENAGMNRTKLQAGFKQLFSKTVYSFTQELKMQKARDLIIDNKGFTLKEIAGMLGYGHANHFSVAFKKRFKAAPSDLKKRG